MDLLHKGSPQILGNEGSLKDGMSSGLSDPCKLNDETSSMSSLTEVSHGGNANGYKLPMVNYASFVHDLLVHNAFCPLNSTNDWHSFLSTLTLLPEHFLNCQRSNVGLLAFQLKYLLLVKYSTVVICKRRNCLSSFS